MITLSWDWLQGYLTGFTVMFIIAVLKSKWK